MNDYSPVDPQRTPRDSLLLMGTIKAVGDVARQSQPIRIRNLSATGMMADSQAAYDVGCLVEIGLRGVGIVAGEVVWVRGDRMGINFAQHIDPKRARQPVISKADENLRVVQLGRVRRPGLKVFD